MNSTAASSRDFLPFLLILAMIPCCVEIDISAPSFPDMAAYFQVPEGMIQMTIASNFLGFCVASLFYGPLSDCYGRRKIMILGNSLLLAGALGCVFPSSMSFLLVARFIQGVGASCAAVVVFAMIADAYQGEKAVKLIGFMNALITVCIAIAPVIGAFITKAIGWRGNYASVAFMCLVSWLFLFFTLPETKKDLETFSLKKLLKNYGSLLSSSKFVGASLIPSLLCSAYIVFVASSAFLYIETFGLSITAYALHQGAFIGSFSLTSLFSSKIVAKWGAKDSVIKGISLSLLGALGTLVVSLIAPASPYLLTSLMIIFCIGFAVVYAVVFAASLEIFPDMKGTVSSAIIAMRALLCSTTVGIISYCYDGQPFRISVVMLAAVILAALFTFQFLGSRPFDQKKSEMS